MGLDERGARTGVGQDPLHLLGTRRLVDRYDHRADGEQREVGDRPLVAGLAHDRDAVAGLDAGRDQSLGDRGHLVGELARGHVLPVPVDPAAQRDVFGRVCGVLEDEVRGVGLRQVVDAAGDGQLAHAACFLSSARCPRPALTAEGATAAATALRMTVTASSVQREDRRPPVRGWRGAVAQPASWSPVTCPAMADESTQSIIIDADPSAIMAVIADFAQLPRVGRLGEAGDVLDPAPDGRARRVAFRLDAGVVRDSVRARLRVDRRHPGRAGRCVGPDDEGPAAAPTRLRSRRPTARTW